ncbi:hypothetical protein, partial [Beduini massiliensis]|uniref:hypothetical protein n=1 Tax=Beduini massiliensis TaxID=1585974 RepID=UPI0035656560
YVLERDLSIEREERFLLFFVYYFSFHLIRISSNHVLKTKWLNKKEFGTYILSLAEKECIYI